MAILEFVNDDYDDPGYLQRITNYIVRPDKTPFDYIGGLGVVASDALFEMLIVKKIFDKTGGRQLRHFVVSFDTHECITAYEEFELAFQIAQYYSDYYQIIFAVHQDEPNIYIHFLFNTVSWRTGLMYAEGKSDFWRLKNHIDILMKQYIFGGEMIC